ncbi:MAG: hypothetical protein WBM04_20755, partial [Candidatus Korobacteraceae bacterium]
ASQHLILLPEKGCAQNDAQCAQDEIGNPKQHQKAAFFAGQARTMKIVFTTEVQKLFSKAVKPHLEFVSDYLCVSVSRW